MIMCVSAPVGSLLFMLAVERFGSTKDELHIHTFTLPFHT